MSDASPPNPAGGQPALGRTLPVFAFAGFTTLVAMRMCDAMLPALGEAFSTTPQEAAHVISAFALAYGCMQLVFGPLGDRFGKLRVISLAAAACAVASAAAALAPTLESLIFARAAFGAGAAGIMPLALAWIGDQVPIEQRNEVLARFATATLSGIMVGAWVGGLITELMGWRAAFWILVPLFAVMTLLLLPLARDDSRTRPAVAASYLRQVIEMLAAPWSRSVLLAVFVEGAFVYGALAFVPSVLQARFDLTLGASGAVLAVFAVGGLVFSRASGRMLRRLRPERLAIVGAAIATAGFVVLAVMPHWGWAILGCGVGGFGFYAFHNTLQTSATQLSENARAFGVALFACALFIGQSLGVTMAAFAFARLPPAVCFAVTAAAVLALGAAFAAVLRARRAAGA